MIVKVQRPVLKPSAPWLVYNKARTLELTIPASAVPQHVQRDMGERFKIYVAARIATDGSLAFGRRVGDQTW